MKPGEWQSLKINYADPVPVNLAKTRYGPWDKAPNLGNGRLGGIPGIMFVTITRRVLIGDRELLFPESVAAAEIHKAGQKGAGGKYYS